MPRLPLDLVFPPRCAGCGTGPWPFCGPCRRSLMAFAPPWCMRCGVPYERERSTCPHCPPAEVSRTRSAFLFEGPARAAIHRLKFSGWRPAATALASSMASAADGFAPEHTVAWVPLSRRRRARRGFDQAELLARALASERGIRAVGLLERMQDTGPQARRAGAERRTALLGSFVAVRPPPPRVLLIDDVVTTGSTAASCAVALRRAGARDVALLTAARSVSAPVLRRYTRPGLAPGSVVARENASR